AYRTSIRTPTGATHFSLVYGSEAVLPLEVQMPSLCVSLREFVSDEDYRQNRLAQLELLDEQHLNALEHHQVYLEHIKRAYNKHLQHRDFEIGDLVLKENQNVTTLERSQR
ncbi:hypothetical protein KI387_010453, partial [Taxus chinensis]